MDMYNYQTFNPKAMVGSTEERKNKEAYNPFKKNLVSIPSFDQLLGMHNMDEDLLIQREKYNNEIINESENELNDELASFDFPNASIEEDHHHQPT